MNSSLTSAPEPFVKTAHLGAPLPASSHAVSVSLPKWDDVVGYEEKRSSVLERLETGYPRFFIHRQVAKLAEAIAPGKTCLPFPSERAAASCGRFIQDRTGKIADIIPSGGVFAVVTHDSCAAALREFWQHTGLIVSSRQAESMLNGGQAKPRSGEVFDSLKLQLARLYDCDVSDVFLQPSGMAAQFAALRAVTLRSPGKRTAQLGFPYVDTFKLQQKFATGGIMLHNIERVEHDLAALLQREQLAAGFCEIPGNPLLGCADLRRVTPVLRKAEVPLVADDVVATPYNIDLRPHADLIATSLTKFISGRGDVMAGALICNPHSPMHHELKAHIEANHEELLWWEDAQVLNELARGFPQRMAKHNANGLLIAERLRSHPAIERVWYPKWEFHDAYESVRRPAGGYGALVTFLPRNSDVSAPLIYDALPFSKGPSLGTVFTLACPFTLLAHYTELEWAESCGVPRNLIRISVGLEDPEELWDGISRALSH